MLVGAEHCRARHDGALLLVDAEKRAYEPRIPIDWCLSPRIEVTDAVAAMTWEPGLSYTVRRS